MRRTKEFDKPDFLSHLLWGVVPDHHTVKPTNDEFRQQRKLLQDLMTPTFLNGVAAPHLYENFMDLIKLWQEKLRLSRGRAFSVKKDIYETTLEAIWVTVFGNEATETIIRNHTALLSPLRNIPLSPVLDEAAEFPKAPAPPAMHALLQLTDSIQDVLTSPFPRVYGFLQRYIPSQRRNQKIKNDALHAEILKAEARMSTKEGSDKITNAVDHILRRESMIASRNNRAPNNHGKVMLAEVRPIPIYIAFRSSILTHLKLFGLLIAGHETTSTTLLWSIKFLSAQQSIQALLRSTLQSSYKAAYDEQRGPTATEIATTPNHYLDACIEELIRHAGTAGLPSRTAIQDAVVLGAVIPKGTTVMVCANYAGTLTPPFAIPASLRSPSYHAAGGGKARDWEPSSIHVFDPEHWLIAGPDGEKTFDATAGPLLQFGAGPRGCFGRRLAYLELRLALVLILWHFELAEVPERYAGMEATEGLTHAPTECFVDLREVRW